MKDNVIRMAVLPALRQDLPRRSCDFQRGQRKRSSARTAAPGRRSNPSAWSRPEQEQIIEDDSPPYGKAGKR